MLTLCLMLSKTYYAQNYAGIISLGLNTSAKIRSRLILIDITKLLFQFFYIVASYTFGNFDVKILKGAILLLLVPTSQFATH